MTLTHNGWNLWRSSKSTSSSQRRKLWPDKVKIMSWVYPVADVFYVAKSFSVVVCVLSFFSHVWLFVTLRTVDCKLLCPWDSPGKNIGVGSHFLLQAIFLTQGLNSDIQQCRQILYCWATREDSFLSSVQFSSVQSLSHVWLFATPWITARQASLSITISWSSLKSRPSSQWRHPAIRSSVVPFSSCPQFLRASESFPMSQLFAWGGQSTGVSASASFLPKKSQGWSPSEWTGWISLQSKGFSRVFSNTTVQSINSSVLNLLHSPTLTSIHDHWKNQSLD